MSSYQSRNCIDFSVIESTGFSEARKSTQNVNKISSENMSNAKNVTLKSRSKRSQLDKNGSWSSVFDWKDDFSCETEKSSGHVRQIHRQPVKVQPTKVEHRRAIDTPLCPHRFPSLDSGGDKHFTPFEGMHQSHRKKPRSSSSHSRFILRPSQSSGGQYSNCFPDQSSFDQARKVSRNYEHSSSIDFTNDGMECDCFKPDLNCQPHQRLHDGAVESPVVPHYKTSSGQASKFVEEIGNPRKSELEDDGLDATIFSLCSPQDNLVEDDAFGASFCWEDSELRSCIESNENPMGLSSGSDASNCEHHTHKVSGICSRGAAGIADSESQENVASALVGKTKYDCRRGALALAQKENYSIKECSTSWDMFRSEGSVQRGEQAVRENIEEVSRDDKSYCSSSTSSLRGVTLRPSGKWQAQCYYRGRSRYVGLFDSQEEAFLAFETARNKLLESENVAKQCYPKPRCLANAEEAKESLTQRVMEARKVAEESVKSLKQKLTSSREQHSTKNCTKAQTLQAD